MNEAIAAAVAGDNYTDALTLGPLPLDVAQGVDVTVQAAAVLAQLFRNSPQGQQTQDDREYLLLPGSRHISNIAGIRFRNQFAGVPAVVTASLTGPDFPLVGPVFADIPTIGAPLFLPAPVKLDAGGAALPSVFTAIPPSGYTGVLILVDTGTAGPVWIQLRTAVPGFGTTDQWHYLPAVTRSFFVFSVPASTVSVSFRNGVAGGTINWLGVWPTSLPAGSYNPIQNTNVPSNPVLYEADGLVVPPGVTTVDLTVPFFGDVEVTAQLLNGVTMFVALLDSLAARMGFEVFVNALGSVSGRLAPGRHQVEFVNTTGVNQTVNLSVIGRYGGLS